MNVLLTHCYFFCGFFVRLIFYSVFKDRAHSSGAFIFYHTSIAVSTIIYRFLRRKSTPLLFVTIMAIFSPKQVTRLSRFLLFFTKKPTRSMIASTLSLIRLGFHIRKMDSFAKESID